MDNTELSEQDLKKFKQIYLENVAEEEKFYKELEIHYKSKGFKTLEEYDNYWNKRNDDKFIKDMKELKRINKVYSKGGYLTR